LCIKAGFEQVSNKLFSIFWHILGKIHVEAEFPMSFHPTKGLACVEKQHT
jgi:hypothetical protein